MVPGDPELKSLGQVAAGTVLSEEYENGNVVSYDKASALFADVVAATGFLCTTPAATANVHQSHRWKEHIARGVVIHEVGSRRGEIHSYLAS